MNRTAVSLFSGVGGFELGLEACGVETILQKDSPEIGLLDFLEAVVVSC